MMYFRLLVLFSVLFVSTAQAVLTVRVTQSAERGVPIAIVPFVGMNGVSGNASSSVSIDAVIKQDLISSGEFKPLAKLPAQPVMGQPVDYAPFKSASVPYLVVGRVKPVKSSMPSKQGTQSKFNVEVSFQLLDVNGERQLLGYRYVVAPKELRRLAHRISDLIFEKLTPYRGVFGTRIAYVSVTRGQSKQTVYRLQVADADGQNARTLVSSKQPIMSPTWSPDGRRIAYVSFRNRKADIYSVTFSTGTEVPLATGKGIFAAPSFSPDGRYLAFSSSQAGSSDIYVMNLQTRQQTRLTRDYGIETEPTWSADSRHVFFTSNRTGKPQVYRLPALGGSMQRVSFDGQYNAAPTISADVSTQHLLAMVHRKQGAFRIAVSDTQRDRLRILTQGKQDESPSFAPNGRRIVYASKEKGRGVLNVVTVDGQTEQQLLLTEGDIREPAWSPLKR